MPQVEMSEYLEIQALEESIQGALKSSSNGGEKIELSDEAKCIALLPKIPNESPRQRKERIKKARVQTEKIGYTFPGVSEEQLNNQMALDEEEEVEDPMLDIDSVTQDAIMKLTMNQPMYYPEDFAIFDYTKVFKFKVTSGATGRITSAEYFKDSKRMLQSDDE